MSLAVYEPVIRSIIAAAVHDGTVSSNDTRPLFATHHPDIPGQYIGQVYRKLQREGVLQRADYVTSIDVEGGNAGKLIPAYKVLRPIISDVQITPAPVQERRPTTQKNPTQGPCASCGIQHERYGPAGQPLCEWCRP